MGATTLIDQVREANFNKINYLLKAGADPNMADKKGRSALLYAARAGESLMVKKLLEYGAHIHLTDKDGKSAIDYARENGRESVVSILEWKTAEQVGK